MAIKWVCPVCSSTNNSEESETISCFVCGGGFRKAYAVGCDASKSVKTTEKKRSLFHARSKVLTPGKAADRTTARSSGKKEIVGWDIKRSDSKSKEAYLVATPIYAKDAEKKRPADSGKKSTVKVKEVKPGLSAISIEAKPWPEHKIQFNKEKIVGSGCTRIERVEMRGMKCYKLFYRNGTERILNVSNMKMVGYATDL